MKKEKKIFKNERSFYRLLTLTLSVVLCTLMVISISFFYRLSVTTTKNIPDQGGDTYKKHFAVVFDENNESIWHDIYESARKEGKKNNIYVEWMGNQLNQQYDKIARMEMAVAAKVDGIIVDGDDTEEMNNLVNKAVNENIPVITVVDDCFGSYRNSFVGFSPYNIGKIYAKRILDLDNKSRVKNVMLILALDKNRDEKRLLYMGVKDGIIDRFGDSNIDSVIIDSSISYDEEEKIDNVFKREKLPDIIVCLDENTTTRVCQQLVDYNRASETKFIGYYGSKLVLDSIENSVADSTVSLPAEKIGKQSIQALIEGKKAGNINDYISLKPNVITKSNIGDYLKMGTN